MADIEKTVKTPWYKLSGSGLSGSTFTLKTESSEEAYKTIFETAWALVILGSLTFVAWFVFLPGGWLDAVLYISLGSLLGYKKKVWVAWIVILFSCLGLVQTFINDITDAMGGRNTILAAFILFFAIKSLYAIWFIQARDGVFTPVKKSHLLGEKVFPYIFWFSLVPLVAVLFLTLVGFAVLATGYEF